MYDKWSKNVAPLLFSVAAIAIGLLLTLNLNAGPGSVPEDREAPFAQAGPDLTVALGEEIVLDGTESFDDVSITSYKWSILYDEEPIVFEGDKVYLAFDAEGTYAVDLMVSDSAGNIAVDTVVVTVVDDDPEL
jgi:hypothetical protein